MTKFRKGEKHVCDDTCKINHTTDFAKDNRLPSGSKVTSTKEASIKAYKKQLDKIATTRKFKEKYASKEDHSIKIPRKKKIEDKVRIPLAELVAIAENSNHVGQIAMEIEKALIRVKRLERDLAD